MAYYLSFVDPKRPKGERFLGGCIVPVGDNSLGGLKIAIKFAWATGCNPGGEVESVFISDQLPKKFERFANRLMSKAEIDDMDMQLACDRN